MSPEPSATTPQVFPLRDIGSLRTAPVLEQADCPWGWYQRLDAGESCTVRRLFVHPGALLGEQVGEPLAEHWVVVRGAAEVTRGQEVFLLYENQSVAFTAHQARQLRNPRSDVLELITVTPAC